MIQFINILLLCVIIVGCPYLAQSQISAIFNKKDLKELKETKTVFFHRKDDDPELLEKALKEVWTLTDIEVASYRKMPAYLKQDGYSYFSINAKWMESSDGPDKFYIDLKLWMPEGKGEETLSEIALHPSNEVFHVLRENRTEPMEGLIYLYTDAELGNWQPGFLQGYLGLLNDQLKEEEERAKYEGIMEMDQLATLAKKPLYVPEYCLRSPYDDSVREAKEVFDEYLYKYEILSDEDLSNKILNDEEPFYYLLFAHIGARGALSIYNSKTHKMIYHTGGVVGIQLSPKNTELISEKIEKSAKKMRKNKR